MTAEMKSDLTSWMVQLADAHPVLRELPEWLRCRLAVEPGSWNFLPGNARMRKRWQERGVLVHLCAGPDEGFTLRRALHQVGGTEAADDLLKIDILRGGDHDMLSDDGVYAGLIRAMLDGKIKALVAGPNCRTRSVLRHRPLPSGRPRPVRGWGGREYGLPGLDPEEIQMLRDDDVMMWRTIFLYMIGKYLSKASGNDPAFPKLMIEQPATPKEYQPETVSFWDTVEWEMLKGEFAWTELTLNQGDHGGQAVKPTTFGGDLELHPGPIKPRGRFEDDVLRRELKRFARWAPGVMTMVAKALQQEVRGRSTMLKALSWVRNGHCPYRRDCRVCQETLSRQKPHRRVQHPWSAVLSLDTAGPFRPGKDLSTVGRKAKYLLVGAYTFVTWLVPRDDEKQKEDDIGDVPLEAPRLERDDGGGYRGRGTEAA